MPPSKIKTAIYNLWPKLVVIVAGFGLYGLAVTWLQGDFKSLVIGIGGGLVAIPLVFIFYEIWQEKSHRKLNNSVYEFAENQMKVSIGAIKSKLELLIDGAFVYFESGRFLVDDEDVENLKVFVQDDDSESLALDNDNLLDFERENIFEALVDGRYLAFQLTDLSLCDELSQVEGLLSNAFIMERLSDIQVRAIIQLIEAVKMLESFLGLHPNVFIPSSIKLHGFRTQTRQDGLSALVFDDPHNVEPVTLDIKPAREAQPSAEALNAYVVNPDYYAVLSDLVYDVVDGINGWRSVSDSAYVDFESGRFEVL